MSGINSLSALTEPWEHLLGASLRCRRLDQKQPIQRHDIVISVYL